MPLKMIAAQHCQKLSSLAKKINAVSHIWWDEQDILHGANTDGVGIVTDIEKNLSFSIKNKTVLIIGAGRAARGALIPIYLKKPTSITLLSRDISKAEDALQPLNNSDRQNISLQCLDYESLKDLSYQFDLIINATSLSLSNELPNISKEVISHAQCVYDMVYKANNDTIFLKHAKNLGVPIVADGMGMLIEHNALVFYHFFGEHPKTAPVRNYFKI